jgi:hypothetical protein
MKITKRQLEEAIHKAYSLGYDDRANQEGYNIAAREKLIDPRTTKRPRHLSKRKVVELALKEGFTN